MDTCPCTLRYDPRCRRRRQPVPGLVKAGGADAARRFGEKSWDANERERKSAGVSFLSKDTSRAFV